MSDFVSCLFVLINNNNVHGKYLYRQSSKRCLSRWDQETPKKYQRTKELTELDPTQGGPSEERCMLDACQLASLSDGQLDHSKSATK